MKTKLIVNPMSARLKTGKGWARIQEILRAEQFPYETAFTTHRGHAVELTREALAAGFDFIVAVGGDGTLNEVVNGMLTTTGSLLNPNAVLGAISTGTGSDFIRTAGLPRDLAQATRHLAHSETTMPVDVGELDYRQDGQERRRYFVNIGGMGFDAQVIERTESKAKRGGGTLPYLSTLVTTISVYRNKELVLCLDEDKRIEGKLNSVVVCNGKYFGGGMKVAPNATLNDGLFDVILIGDMSTFEVIANTPKIYNGTHLSHPKVSEYRARTVSIEPKERMMIEADGEWIGQGAATFRIHPLALNLRV